MSNKKFIQFKLRDSKSQSVPIECCAILASAITIIEQKGKKTNICTIGGNEIIVEASYDEVLVNVMNSLKELEDDNNP